MVRDMERDGLVDQHGPYSQTVQDYDARIQREKQAQSSWEMPPSGSPGSGAGGGLGGGGSARGGLTAIGLVILGFIGVAFFFGVFDKPETDNIRPAGVSQQEFERNPTAGKVKIEKCGNYYKYAEAGQGSRPSRFTYSSTPPQAETDYIDEGTTILVRGLGTGRPISRGRRLSRAQVMPVEHGMGNYLVSGGEKVYCTDFYYTPPSTASARERHLAGR